MAKQVKRDNFKSTQWTSPIAPMIFAHLDAPNKPFEVGGIPKYEAALVLDENLEQIVVAKCREIWVGAGLDPKKYNAPIKEYTNKSGETIRFLKTASANKPPVFDAKRQSIPPNVVPGPGSIVRLDLGLKPYTGMGGGVTAYLNGVQVLDLKQSGGRGAAAFDNEDGYEVETPRESTFDSDGGMHNF